MEEYIQIAKHIGPKYDFDKNDARQSNDIVEGDDVGHNYMPQYHSEQSADTIYQLDNSNDLSQYFTNPKSDVLMLDGLNILTLIKEAPTLTEAPTPTEAPTLQLAEDPIIRDSFCGVKDYVDLTIM